MNKIFWLLAGANLMLPMTASAQDFAPTKLNMDNAKPEPVVQNTLYVAQGGSDDNNDCLVNSRPCKSLGFALERSRIGDVVSVGPGTFKEHVAIYKSVTVKGSGSTGPNKTTIVNDDGKPTIYIMNDFARFVPVYVTFDSVDLSGNSKSYAVAVNNASMDFVDSHMDDNKGGIFATVRGRMRLIRSTFERNKTAALDMNDQYGLQVIGDSWVSISHSKFLNGGAIQIGVNGTVEVDHSTFDRNPGAGVALYQNAYAVVRNSTISNPVPFDPSTCGACAGIPYGQGVLVHAGAKLILENSTISNAFGQGVLAAGATVNVRNSLITGTRKSNGTVYHDGAVVVSTADPEADDTLDVLSRVTIQGSILANQGPGVPDCGGYVVDEGYNLASDSSCKFDSSGLSLNATNPKLGTLSNNGGPTLTIQPAKTSPALNRIPVGFAGCVPFETDQRGSARSRGGRCDLGPVEVSK